MSAAEPLLSPAVQTAWKIAASSARSAGRAIEPIHFLYGIFCLDNLPATSLSVEESNEISAEVEELGRLISDQPVNFQSIRRNVRSESAFAASKSEEGRIAGGPVNRSDAVRSAFTMAASSSGDSKLGLVPLTHELLLREPRGKELFNLDTSAYERLHKGFRGSERKPDDPVLPTEEPGMEEILIFDSLDAEEIEYGQVNWGMIGPHFALLCELGWQTGTEAKIETLYEGALEMILAAIPAAQQVAIMVTDCAGDLLLKAHLPKGVFSASTSSAHKAMMQKRSFIWQRGEDLSASQLASSIQAGIYAPILSTSETFGVICVDAHTPALQFTRDDLFLVTSLGHQLGLTVANRKLEDELRRSAKLLERLLTNFSPKVRDRLMLKAEAGRLKLGGERSVISILCCDIRGFTLITAGMDTEDVVSLLNDYFSAMVTVIFRHGGSVDKFIGNAILAVFGSPEADAMQAENSLRAALEMQLEVRNLSARRKSLNLQPCEVGIGVHTGEVIHGFIGSPDRMEFTVIGSAVNLASRYCDAARAGEVILSGEMLERVWKQAVVEAVDVQTKHEGTLSAYRLIQMRAAK